jgi:hypothetical protein
VTARKAPAKKPEPEAPEQESKTSDPEPTPETTTAQKDSKEKQPTTVTEHQAALPIPPTDESAAQFQQEQDELQQPGEAREADASHIDNDPGYSEDQLAHMREYYGLTEDDHEEETGD